MCEVSPVRGQGKARLNTLTLTESWFLLFIYYYFLCANQYFYYTIYLIFSLLFSFSPKFFFFFLLEYSWFRKCCVHYCCTTKWFFLYPFPLWYIMGYWIQSSVFVVYPYRGYGFDFPCLHDRHSLCLCVCTMGGGGGYKMKGIFHSNWLFSDQQFSSWGSFELRIFAPQLYVC